eukprot:TRINITY_DN1426_c2_g1_i1.p1 TRINITY_DN1426_c2_g1~~TRINITY_DN1426_c2_g1_i1.p1  ORF type:complete len:720 (+),score=237.40 TRINITY_DN1426_c2_g1_i1:85-2244(+)
MTPISRSAECGSSALCPSDGSSGRRAASLDLPDSGWDVVEAQQSPSTPAPPPQRSPSTPAQQPQQQQQAKGKPAGPALEQLRRCADGCYCDRGPAFPTGRKARCQWCGGRTWNRGCSECKSNFHKTCYYVHLAQAKSAVSERGGAEEIPPELLRERELRPFLTAVGMMEYLPLLVQRGVNGHQDLLRFGNEDWLRNAGITKVVHRRKLLRQIAQLQVELARRAKGDSEALQVNMTVTRPSPDVKLGLTLAEAGGRVHIREVAAGSVAEECGLEAGMTVINIEGQPVTSQQSFMSFVKGRTSFQACIQTRDGRLPRGPFESLFPGARDGRLKKEDFEKLRLIGKGAFSDVFLVRSRKDGRLYALKALEKCRVLETAGDGRPSWRRDQLLRERDMMKHTQWTHSNLLVRLHGTFQSRTQLFFVIDYCAGGDLYEYLGTKEGSCLSEPDAQYYAAQIFLGLRALHTHGIVYRDLKPENVLLDEVGNAKLADFGLSRPLTWGARATTFVGTPQYIAPEMIEGRPYSFAVDWWAFGVVIFNMVTGDNAFGRSCDSAEDVWRSVLRNQVKFRPDSGASLEVRSLVSGLLEKDPDLRLEGDVIRRQPWFAGTDFAALERGECRPPGWVPPAEMVTEGSAQAQALIGSHIGSPEAQLSDTQQALFKGFSYGGDSALGLGPSGPSFTGAHSFAPGGGSYLQLAGGPHHADPAWAAAAQGAVCPVGPRC